MFQLKVSAAVVLFLSLGCIVSSFDLACQPPTRWARFLHTSDVSPSMTPFLDVMKNGTIREFDDWTKVFFSSGSVSAVGYFTTKATADAPSDTCWTLQEPFSPAPLGDVFDAIPMDVGSNPANSGVLDALYYSAAAVNWESPLPAGRRIVFLYTNKLPQFPPTVGLPEFSPTDLRCDDYDLPEVQTIIDYLGTNFYVVLVVPIDLMSAYEAAFGGFGGRLIVVPMLLRSDDMTGVLFAAMDNIICGTALPTYTTTSTTTTTTTTTATTTGSTSAVTIDALNESTPVFVTVQPPPENPCSAETLLQLLHLQDMSWSYTNDLVHLKAKMPDLLDALEFQFFQREAALATFVDKPLPPTGYPGDYCYAEELNFTTVQSDYETKLNAIPIRSGADWAESQLDALKGGLMSDSLGWKTGTSIGGKYLLRVVLLVTDAGPHRQGDHGDLPTGDNTSFNCNRDDYPSASDLRALFTQYGVYPIVVVTSDIYNYWRQIVPQLSDEGHVISLADPIDDILLAIETALENVCVASRRLLNIDTPISS